MITGLDWMESELKRHKDALDKMSKLEKVIEIIDSMDVVPFEDKELKEKESEAKLKLKQDKYKAKMYIAMLEYAIRNHMEFKDYRE